MTIRHFVSLLDMPYECMIYDTDIDTETSHEDALIFTGWDDEIPEALLEDKVEGIGFGSKITLYISVY